MVESKDNHSRFIPYKNNIVRFSVDAFLFKEMPYQVCHELGKLLFDFSSYVAVFTKSVSFITSVNSFVFWSSLAALHALQHVCGQFHPNAYSQVLQLRHPRRKVKYFCQKIKTLNFCLTVRIVFTVCNCFLRWVELYGLESVCTCCDSICSSSASTGQSFIC